MNLEMWNGLFDPVAWSALIKIGIAAILAGMIGWERELRGHQAGVRTHMLLAIGVALFCELSVRFTGDSSRVAAQVVTGIGFLGAGAILRVGGDIKGLTTSASIWAVAAIAMSVSQGGPFLTVAVFATILSLFTLAVVDHLEVRWMKTKRRRRMGIHVQDSDAFFSVVDELSNAPGCTVLNVQVIEREPDIQATVTLRGSEDLITRIARSPGVKTVEWLT